MSILLAPKNSTYSSAKYDDFIDFKNRRGISKVSATIFEICLEIDAEEFFEI